MTRARAYEVLGIPAGAGKADARKAYRKLAMLWHPDRNGSDGAPQRFMEITEAYEVLTEGRSKLDSVFSFDEEMLKRRYQAWYRRDDEERRARAREYARKRYEESLEEIRQLREAWYFPIFWVFNLAVIAGMLILSLMLILVPVLLIYSGSYNWLFLMVILAPMSFSSLVGARDHWRFLKAYLEKQPGQQN